MYHTGAFFFVVRSSTLKDNPDGYATHQLKAFLTCYQPAYLRLCDTLDMPDKKPGFVQEPCNESFCEMMSSCMPERRC